DTRLYERRGERREVRLGEALRRDSPDISNIAKFLRLATGQAAISVRALCVGVQSWPAHSVAFGFLFYRLCIEVVAIRLGEKEDILVSAGRTIRNAFRHWVGLVPDDGRAQIPTVGLEREGDAPRDTYEVFPLD